MELQGLPSSVEESQKHDKHTATLRKTLFDAAQQDDVRIFNMELEKVCIDFQTLQIMKLFKVQYLKPVGFKVE